MKNLVNQGIRFHVIHVKLYRTTDMFKPMTDIMVSDEERDVSKVSPMNN